MIHQPLGGAGGQATDVLISARHLERTRTRLTDLLQEYTGQNREKLVHDMEQKYDTMMQIVENCFTNK